MEGTSIYMMFKNTLFFGLWFIPLTHPQGEHSSKQIHSLWLFLKMHISNPSYYKLFTWNALRQFQKLWRQSLRKLFDRNKEKCGFFFFFFNDHFYFGEPSFCLFTDGDVFAHLNVISDFWLLLYMQVPKRLLCFVVFQSTLFWPWEWIDISPLASEIAGVIW